MGTFAAIVRGNRHRKPIKFPLLGRPEEDVALTILTPLEALQVLEKSRAFAIERGVQEPSDGNPIYDFAIQVHTLALSCVDPTSPENDPRPYFADVQQIVDSGGLISTETIAYVFALYEQLVDEMAVRKADLTKEGFLRLLHDTEQGETLPFSKLRPGTQWSCFRFLAVRHLNCLRGKCSSSSASATEKTESDESEAKASSPSSPH